MLAIPCPRPAGGSTIGPVTRVVSSPGGHTGRPCPVPSITNHDAIGRLLSPGKDATPSMQTHDKPFNPVGALRASRVASPPHFTMDGVLAEAPRERSIGCADPIPPSPEGDSFLGVSI